MKKISFFNKHPKFLLSNKKQLKNGLLCVLSKETKYTEIQINIVLLSDDSLLEINKNYLDHDYYTDIITFPLEITDKYLEAELYISIDRVKDNADVNNVEFSNEFKRVLIHGVLHLCAYNDKSVDEIIIMREKEDYYLSSECFT